jgi:phosphate-selective porin OprO/OprP
MRGVRLLLSLAVISGWLAAGPCAAQGRDDLESRIRDLEGVMRDMASELQALKEELARARQEEVEARARKEEAGGGATAARGQQEIDDVRYELQQTRERLEALQSRADTQMPSARLGDGLIVEDPRGRWAVRATVRMQADYRDFGESGVLADTFSIRRARTGLGLTLARLFTVYVEGEFARGPTQAGTQSQGTLHQAWVDFAPSDRVRLRVGQFKPAFGLELTQTSWQYDFQERSLAANLVTTARNDVLFDRGIMLYGLPLPGIGYAVSYMNGTGSNLDEYQRTAREAGSSGKDTVVRVTLNPAEWLGKEGWIWHAGGSYRTGRQANGSSPTGGYTAPLAVTEARGIPFFNPTSFNESGSANAAAHIDRSMVGGELAWARRSWKMQGELFRASYGGSLADGVHFSRDIRTGYLQINWLASGEDFTETYRNTVFGRIRPNNQFGLGPGAGWGALELGLRWSFWDATDFQSGNPPDTGGLGGTVLAPGVTQSTNRANAWTLGLKWMPTLHTAFMVNFVHTNFGTPVVANGRELTDERAITFRAQYDLY